MLLREAFAEHEGQLALAHEVAMNGGEGDFIGGEVELENAPRGFSLSVEQTDAEQRVQWETQVIR